MTTNNYHFECSCGENYTNIAAARACRKCRVYLGHSCEEVVDVRHGGIVWTHVVVNWAVELAGAESKWPTLAAVWPR